MGFTPPTFKTNGAGEAYCWWCSVKDIHGNSDRGSKWEKCTPYFVRKWAGEHGIKLAADFMACTADGSGNGNNMATPAAQHTAGDGKVFVRGIGWVSRSGSPTPKPGTTQGDTDKAQDSKLDGIAQVLADIATTVADTNKQADAAKKSAATTESQQNIIKIAVGALAVWVLWKIFA